MLPKGGTQELKVYDALLAAPALASLARIFGSQGRRVRLLLATRHTSLSMICGTFTFHNSRRLRSMLARGTRTIAPTENATAIFPLTAFILERGGRTRPAHSICRDDASRILVRSLSAGRRRIKN